MAVPSSTEPPCRAQGCSCDLPAADARRRTRGARAAQSAPRSAGASRRGHTAAGASKTRAWLREALGGVCDDAPFRHARPLAVETFCEELFDEHEDDVVAAVDSFYAAVRALEIPSLDLEASICVEVAGACAAEAVKDARAAAEL